jgi:translation elongation factor EF-Tu-like GTPase
MSDKLETLLKQVHAELRKVDKVDAESLKLLEEVEQDVQSLLKKSGGETPSILSRMQKAVDRFEVEHPTLATLLSEVSAILNNAGI